MNHTGYKAAIPNPALSPFGAFVGEWETSGSHPQVPGVVLHGHASFKWIEGGAFLVMHSEIFDERFPAGVSIFASDDSLGEYFMLYFDEREVSRKSDVSIMDNCLTWERKAPGFSQRYSFTISADANTIISKGELSKDDVNWEKDLDLTYTRVR